MDTAFYQELLKRLLQVMIDNSVSDLFLTVGAHPVIRVFGDLFALSEGLDILRPEDTEGLIHELLVTDERREKYKVLKELDFSFGQGDERFRVNVFRQKGNAAAVLRYLPSKLYTIESLGLPEMFRDVTKRSSGVVLVAGPTGSGKSTTLASMIDEINSQQKKHIITIEDPIEYVHKHKKSIIEQREVGEDTESFAKALRSSLRENPDVVMVGEMRDLESIRNTLTLAETGHLVFATIHSRSSAQTITKIIDSFPAEQQNQIRLQLSEAVIAIFNQRLLRNVGGNGYVLVTETMIANNAIRNLIRENKVFQVNSQIQMGVAEGMHLLEDDIIRVIKEGRVKKEEGMKHANDPQSILQAV
jgi:twitching motility protein PilT